MPRRFCYDYPRPAVTVDIVVFATIEERLRVLLIRRKHDPFAGLWALPGGFLEIDETFETAAKRELQEETGLQFTGNFEQIGIFGQPGRDPRGRTISVAYAGITNAETLEVQGNDDAEKAEWFDVASPPSLAFDHDEILATGLGWYRRQRPKKK